MKNKLKYKVGDIRVWHWPWFDSSMDRKIIIGEILDGDYPYKAKFYNNKKDT